MTKVVMTSTKIFLLVLTIVFMISLIQQGHAPEDYDQAGLGVFVFFIGLGVWMLRTKTELSDNFAFIVLLIGIAGLLTDGSIVFGIF